MAATVRKYETDLTDEEWVYIDPFVRAEQGQYGPKIRVSRREVVNAIRYVPHTGCQWRLIPNDFPNRFCICVTHPLHDAGSFTGKGEDSAFTIFGSYLGRRPYEGTFERDGLRMTFSGWCYALEDYARHRRGGAAHRSGARAGCTRGSGCPKSKPAALATRAHVLTFASHQELM
jgi:hypothetical protein